MAIFRSYMLVSFLRCAAVPLILCAGAVADATHAQEVKIGGTGSGLGTMQLLAQEYAKNQSRVKITILPSMGSSGGIKALLAGVIDIGVSSRPLTEAESKAGAVATEYGRTPFVFATSLTTKTSSITTQDLINFYSGKLVTWPDGSKLRLVLRPIGDSDSEMIKNISAGMREAKEIAEKRKGMAITVTDQETADYLEKIPGAIGPSTLAQLLSERRALKALALDGVTPSAQAISSGSYPLFRTLLLVTGPKTSPEGLAFVTFAHSDAARTSLQQSGHWVK
jgi:phosphate transport system substrate-binding protein